MSQQWISITIEAEPGPAQAVAVDLLLNAGCKGVRIDEAGTPVGVVHLISYLADSAAGKATVNAIQASLLMLPALGIDGVAAPAAIGIVDEEDWATGWKKYFKPIRIGRHIIVTPPWESPEIGSGDIDVVIDPGMAFGTGTHPTTQLCLVALERFVKPGDSVADIGTGSGILSIAAAKLGAGNVCAVDNDPLAVSIAAANASVNGVAVETSESFPSGRLFDVVMANIIADTLIELSTALYGITKPGGILVASGIIDTREGDVVAAMERAGFELLDANRQSEWVALVCRRGAA